MHCTVSGVINKDSVKKSMTEWQQVCSVLLCYYYYYYYYYYFPAFFGDQSESSCLENMVTV